jgi:hypothetical protein
MGLALGARTRLDAALEAALPWLAQNAAASDRVRWLAAARAALELAPGERPDPAWLAPGASDEDAGDEPGTSASSGRATIGRARCGSRTTNRRSRAPTRLVRERRPGRARRDRGRRTRDLAVGRRRHARGFRPRRPLSAALRVAPGATLPPVLERVLTAWCEARALRLARGAEPGALLVLELAPGDGREQAVELARDGWRARGRAVHATPAEELAAGAGWLSGAAADGATLVALAARAGRVTTWLRALDEPAGDPAGFALSFARLFDRCARAARA